MTTSNEKENLQLIQTEENNRLEKPVKSHRFWDTVHFLFAFCLVSAVLYYLIKTPTDTFAPPANRESMDKLNDAKILSNGDIQLKEKSPFFERLSIETITKTKTQAPLFEATGIVSASHRKEGEEYQWQFSSSDLLTLFTDWQKSVNDVAFYEKQLVSTKELAKTKYDALEKQLERKKKLVKIGTDTEQDLATAEAELLQVQIEERKNVYEAEMALRTAKKSENTLSKQLEQGGLKPQLLDTIVKDHDIIRANIPGTFFNKVFVGQECQASFQNLPGIRFTGKICEIIPVLSQELGMLCVLFVVQDSKDLLRPGMFADIGIGTEERDILTVPSVAVVHIGDSDFVLTQKKENIWSVKNIKAGNLYEKKLEVISGLSQDDKVIGQGVILLKGYMSEVVDQFPGTLTKKETNTQQEEVSSKKKTNGDKNGNTNKKKGDAK